MVPMEECDKVYPHSFAREDAKKTPLSIYIFNMEMIKIYITVSGRKFVIVFLRIL